MDSPAPDDYNLCMVRKGAKSGRQNRASQLPAAHSTTANSDHTARSNDTETDLPKTQALSLLENRLKDLNEHIRSMATIYWSWYGFFWTLNGVVLAWWCSKGQSDPSIDHLRWPIAALFFLLAAASSLASFWFSGVLREWTRRTQVLSELLVAVIRPRVPNDVVTLLSSATYPARIGVGAPRINGAMLLLLGLLWGYISTCTPPLGFVRGATSSTQALPASMPTTAPSNAPWTVLPTSVR